MIGSHVAPGNILRFRFNHHTASGIGVAGNFTDWHSTPMAPLGDGWWGLDVGPVGSGNVYYKFVTPEGWAFDQYNFRRTMDGANSFLNVGGSCGHMLRRWFHSQSLGKGKDYLIYLPPAYSLNADLRFPYLILMGGLFEGSDGWALNASIHEKLDTLIGNGLIPQMIVVMPDKDEAVFHPEAWEPYFHFLSEEVTGHIDREYRTLPIRGVEGLSLGAVWAVQLTTCLPERYCSASSLSGYMDAKTYRLVSHNQDRMRASGARVRLACGTGEGEVIDNNRNFHRYLQSIGIASEFCVNEGVHRWPLWEGQIAHSLAFHGHSFRLRL